MHELTFHLCFWVDRAARSCCIAHDSANSTPRVNGHLQARPAFELGKDNLTAEFLAKSPQGKVPVLETPHG